MKLPSFRWLQKSDYEEKYMKLVETLGRSLNYGIDSLYQVLNKNASLRDNIKCTVKDVTFQVDSSGAPTVTTSFLLDISGKIDGISVINAINQTNSAIYPSTAPFVSFTQNDKVVTITNVTGLQINNTYTLRVVAWNN